MDTLRNISPRSLGSRPEEAAPLLSPGSQGSKAGEGRKALPPGAPPDIEKEAAAHKPVSWIRRLSRATANKAASLAAVLPMPSHHHRPSFIQEQQRAAKEERGRRRAEKAAQRKRSSRFKELVEGAKAR